MSMTRTPVTVAEMVNGDLIAHSNWEDDGDDKVATFIGRIPLSPCQCNYPTYATPAEVQA